MLAQNSVKKIKKLFFFFSKINQSLLDKKIFFFSSFFTLFSLFFFFLNLGIIGGWELLSQSNNKKKKIFYKIFLRYKKTKPLGFFWNYNYNLKKGIYTTLNALRLFLSYRPGITLLLLTNKGLLTSQQSLTQLCGGIVIGILV